MTEPLPVQGLFETHLTVSDVNRSLAFYRDVVGLTLALELPDRAAAFFWIAEPGGAMLGIWSLGSAPIGLSLHVAFKTSLSDVMGACERLHSLGITPLSFFATEANEPSVIGWMPAAAVYFRDPDGHLLEYLAMVDEPARPDLGIVPWSQWEARDATCATGSGSALPKAPRRDDTPSPSGPWSNDYEREERTMSQPVTETTWEKEVLQAARPVLVDFWAEWCMPCHAVAPLLERIADERNLKLVKVNYDEEQELAARYGVLSIPNIMLFEDGEPKAQTIGARPKGDLERALGLAA